MLETFNFKFHDENVSNFFNNKFIFHEFDKVQI